MASPMRGRSSNEQRVRLRYCSLRIWMDACQLKPVGKPKDYLDGAARPRHMGVDFEQEITLFPYRAVGKIIHSLFHHGGAARGHFND